MMAMIDRLRDLKRESIRLMIQGEPCAQVGGTRFGGVPDVPSDFSWPIYNTETYDDDTVKPRPLAFLAQFNCAQLPKIEGEISLPQTGVLSFFYELDSMKWGYDPKDAGCARVFWFEDITEISKATFPEELAEYYRLPAITVEAQREDNYPAEEDFFSHVIDWEEYESSMQDLGVELPDNCSKLLGWPNIIQNNMTVECEMVSRGYYLGGGWDKLPQDVLENAKQNSQQDWVLLFQLDTVEKNGFQLMFGDCGRVYFYIRREDLISRRFDRVWLVLQCC